MDWTFADAVEAGVVPDAAARAEVDLRGGEWPVGDQGTTGACVGFAAADGVLHWHYRQAGLLAEGERPSPRFIWMANKETDLLTSFPTTFIESAGTQIKLAAALLGVLGALTWQQASLYRDGITFFNHVIAQNHRAREAHLNLGTALLKWNLLDEALAAYRVAGEQRPKDCKPPYGAGIVLYHLGRLDGDTLVSRRPPRTP